MNALVTGAGGFVGSHLVDSLLARGQQVRAIDLHLERLDHLAGHPDLECMTADLTDSYMLPRLVADMDVIYHLASAHLDVSKPEDYYYQVNVQATESLLNAAYNAGVSRFVHCSSNGVLGEISHPPADETTPCQPTNIYEQTKLLGEQAALAFYQETGFPVVVARPAWVYGPRCPRTERLLRTVRKGRFIMFGSGRTLRHPIYIGDAVRALELCAEQGAPGEIYFLAGEQAVTLNELIHVIADVFEVSRSFLRLPMFLGYIVAFGAQTAFQLLGQKPPISRRTLDFYLKDNAYDISKARRDLNFAPAVSLTAGLRQTVACLPDLQPVSAPDED